MSASAQEVAMISASSQSTLSISESMFSSLTGVLMQAVDTDITIKVSSSFNSMSNPAFTAPWFKLTRGSLTIWNSFFNSLITHEYPFIFEITESLLEILGTTI